jgi:hypothetical protein
MIPTLASAKPQTMCYAAAFLTAGKGSIARRGRELGKLRLSGLQSQQPLGA